MTWYDVKQAAVDPDNPAANEQIPFSEWNAMVTYLKDKIIDKGVNDAAIGNDKVLVYKTATSTFVFEAQTGGAAAINDLTDVTISGVPADNEVLAYDTGTSEWINQTAAEVGLATVAGLASYLALAGGTMAGNLNMGDYLIDAVDDIQAYDTGGITFRNSAAASRILLASTSYAFTAFANASMNNNKLLLVTDPTSAQDASTKNYDDTHLFTKEAVTSFTDGYIPVYRTASGKFEMEDGGGSAGLPVADTTAVVKGSADGTKLVRFEADGLTTGTTRVMTVPDKDITLCDTAEALLKTGGTMSGDILLDGNDIRDIGYIEADGAGGIVLYDMASTEMARFGVGAINRFGATCDMYGNNIDNVGALILNDATELTISGGEVTATQSYHTIDTEGDAASDDLDGVFGGTAGQILTIRAASGARTVVCKDGAGMALEGDMSLDNTEDTLTVLFTGSTWVEISRSNNGA